MAIQPLDGNAVHRICSGQVVVDLATAVKELVENAVDSGATIIDVKLKDSGMTSLQVTDNGSGIDEKDFESVALKHHTSKLSLFEDLDGVSTFGFRGEALSSLCALGHVTITTCTQSTAPIGVKLEYNQAGVLQPGREAVACQRGTSITIQDLFCSLPVRQREFKKNVKRELQKAVTLLQAYGVILKNVRLSCSNQTGKGSKSTLLQTHGNSSVRVNITNIFGPKAAADLIDFELPLHIEDNISVVKQILSKAHMSGCISRPTWGSGRPHGDRQFISINSRPCLLPRVMRCLNEVYKTYNHHQVPFVVLDLQLPEGTYDFNVSPDKRSIFVHDEDALLEAIKKAMGGVFEPYRGAAGDGFPDSSHTQSSTPIPFKPSISEIESSAESQQTSADKDVSVERSAAAEQSFNVEQLPGDDVTDPSPEEADSAGASQLSRQDESVKMDLFEDDASNQNIVEKATPSDGLDNASETSFSRPSSPIEVYHSPVFTSTATLTSREEESGKTEHSHKRRHLSKGLDNAGSAVLPITPDTSPVVEFLPPTSASQRAATRSFPVFKNPIVKQGMTVNWNKQADRWKRRRRSKQSKRVIDPLEGHPSASEEQAPALEDNDASEQTLNRILHQQDFANVRIIGQFNRSFILVSLHGNIFIIDQHAADEKYNFERLNATAKIESQSLIRPRQMQLAVMDELVAMSCRSILEKNGFEIRVNEDAPPTQRIALLTQPVVGQRSLDHRDFEELLTLLRDNEDPNTRCSKLRSIFASRACRSSVMVGHALNSRQMNEIVAHMGTMRQPWNCPHGRPTCRLLQIL